MNDVMIDEWLAKQAEESCLHGYTQGRRDVARLVLATIIELAPKSGADAIEEIERICREVLNDE